MRDDADRWPDELRISDVKDKFVSTVCGERGADIRPEWQTAVQVFPPLAAGASVEEAIVASVGGLWRRPSLVQLNWTAQAAPNNAVAIRAASSTFRSSSSSLSAEYEDSQAS